MTSCFVNIQWPRKRCMADSVARRPHTATSVRGLISLPSPILVVWLPFAVFLSSLPLTRLHLPIPQPSYFPSQYSLPSLFPRHLLRLIVFISSPADPSVALYLLASPIFHRAPSHPFPAAPISSSFPSLVSQAAHSSPERFAPSSRSSSSPPLSSSLPVYFPG